MSSEEKKFGLSIQGSDFHFRLYSQTAPAVWVGLFAENGTLQHAEPLVKEGSFWHVCMKKLHPDSCTYAFKIQDEWLADPYAKAIQSPSVWGQTPDEGRSVRAFLAPCKRPFDWQGTTSPRIPRQNLIIYEMHVRGFTRSPTSKTSAPGTFQGVIEKIPYLKKLGVNAIELLPIFEFDETYTKNKAQKGNYWGYNPLHYFTPMRRYAQRAHEPFGPIDECKEMIRELHKEGIEVILDVVYNHTGEGEDPHYKIHFRGIDPATYYMLDPQGHLRNYAGCGNVVNVNQPMVTQWILDSLRFWVEEFHVDGFRFDLAAIFRRGTNGQLLEESPLLQQIEKDPVLSSCKLIAEVWDAAGLYLAGDFAKKGRWMEWNGKYRDHVRRFIKGNAHEAGSFATSLCGSDVVFSASHTPLSSINFITAHDGFTLRDLVSYEQKHNQENGENNQDGCNANDSSNYGVEGKTEDPCILSLRERQMRNFLLTLFISQGIPMLTMRDEYGHSQNGNNNPYVHDSFLNWFHWDHGRDDIVEFVSKLIQLKKSEPLLKKDRFLTDKDIQWVGSKLEKLDFQSSFIAFVLQEKNAFYFAFNASNQKVTVQLPPQKQWKAVIQTEKNWNEQPWASKAILPSQLEMAPHSALCLRAAPGFLKAGSRGLNFESDEFLV